MTQRLDYTKLAPEGAKALGGVHAYVAKNLPAELVDLVYLRVSQINGCAYCIDLHSRDLRKNGVEWEKIVLVQVWREATALFSEREQVALAWAESLTDVARTGVPDADFSAASALFAEKELADLTIAIGLMNAYNRLGVGLRLTPGAARQAASDARG